MMAITRKIATERIAIGKKLVLKTSEVTLSLKQAKKGNISKISEIKIFPLKLNLSPFD